MRAFLIALMIIVLPVRGWMGDAMAIGMAGTQRGANSAPLEHKMAADHEDCAGTSMTSMGAAATHGQGAGGAATGSAHCESCSVCQVCNMVALTLHAPHGYAVSATQISPVGVLSHFASAYLRRGQKPPIS